MESRMTELMEAIQESEGQAERRVLTLLTLPWQNHLELTLSAQRSGEADAFLKRHWS